MGESEGKDKGKDKEINSKDKGSSIGETPAGGTPEKVREIEAQGTEATDGHKPAHHRLTKKELEEKVEELETKSKAAEEQAKDYLDSLQRLKAEFDNYRKRMIKEQTAIIESANSELVARLLPVVDNMERALDAADKEASGGLYEGIRMVYNQLMEVLSKEGLETIDPQGQPFDPRECEAVNALISDDHEDNTVVEVHQKGYKWKGKLLRPAMATVSKCRE